MFLTLLRSAALGAALTAMAAPAHALTFSNGSATITGTTFSIAPNTFYETFTVTNTSTSNAIIKIEIPEITLGDLKFAPAPSASAISAFLVAFNPALPVGWAATETATPTIVGSGLYSGIAAGYVELTTFLTGIAPGATLSFNAQIPTLSTTNAAFGLSFAASEGVAAFTGVIDPPIPNTNPPATTVPEPVSLAVLAAGLTSLMGLRRCKRG